MWLCAATTGAQTAGRHEARRAARGAAGHLRVGERGRQQLQRVGQADRRPARDQLGRRARLARVAPVHAAQHLRGATARRPFRPVMPSGSAGMRLADTLRPPARTAALARCAGFSVWIPARRGPMTPGGRWPHAPPSSASAHRLWASLPGLVPGLLTRAVHAGRARAVEEGGTLVSARGSAVRLLRKRQMSARSSALSALRAQRSPCQTRCLMHSQLGDGRSAKLFDFLYLKKELFIHPTCKQSR